MAAPGTALAKSSPGRAASRGYGETQVAGNQGAAPRCRLSGPGRLFKRSPVNWRSHCGPRIRGHDEHQRTADLPTTLIWWSALSAAAAINVVAWSVSAWLLGRRRAQLPPDIYATRRRLLWLAAIYVLGCGFRSVLPMIDVPRFCLHDTWVSYIVIGRSVATIAELAFAVQWALLLHEAGARRAAPAVVPLIAVAEALSWLATLTTNNLFHAVENSLWTLTAVLALVFLASRWRLVGDRGKRVIAAAIGCGAAYIAFMVIVDVPMYLARWQPGQEYLSLGAGMREILQRCIVNRDWAKWQADALWLTLYFTVAVWISIALPLVPPLKGNRR
jgi:hypothetical protein